MLDFVRNFTIALNHDDGVQAGSVAALLEPGDVVDEGVGSGLDAAMITVDRFMASERGILDAIGLLPGSENFAILAQGAPFGRPTMRANA